jgi:peroxiredoxin Q/BCP
MRLADGRIISPQDFRGQKLVVFLCPAGDPSACANEIEGFAGLVEEFEDCGTWILGLLTDGAQSGGRFMLPRRPTIRLAVDPNGLAATRFGTWMHRSGLVPPGYVPDRAALLFKRDGTVHRIWRDAEAEGLASQVLEAARELP